MIDFKKTQCIGNRPIIKYYFAATLLTNCHSCFYGNQIATLFSCQTPSLAEYLGGRG
jgi:hypothetical protein